MSSPIRPGVVQFCCRRCGTEYVREGWAAMFAPIDICDRCLDEGADKEGAVEEEEAALLYECVGAA